MCREEKDCLMILLAFLLLCSLAGALRAEEQWHLISEGELASIEQWLARSEREKASWLLQAAELRAQAERLAGRAESLQAESEGLNRQLREAREQSLRLEQSFNESEAGWLAQLSMRDGEIARLTAEAARLRGIAPPWIVAAVALALAWAAFFAAKIARVFKAIPF